jgi:anti-sigma28 factor (negative regulator of flagellin synthesis)
MDAVDKELEGRKKNIKREVELLFKANMKFTDWDVPEADDTKVAHILLTIIQEKLDEIKQDIEDGKYENY